MHTRRDLRKDGRIILAWGEVTGHCHQVVTADTGLPPGLEAAQFFSVDSTDPHVIGELVVLAPCVLRHGTIDGVSPDHDPIALDPQREWRSAEVIRQGDIALVPKARGVWEVRRQADITPEAWRMVAD